MNELSRLAQSLYHHPHLPAQKIRKLLSEVGLEFPIRIAVGASKATRDSKKQLEKYQEKYFWSPHPGLVYILWSADKQNAEEAVLQRWRCGEVFECEKPDRFITLLQDAIVSFRQQELHALSEKHLRTLSFAAELDARRLAHRKIQIELEDRFSSQQHDWETALILWIDTVLLRHRGHLHTVRRKLLEFLGLLTCDVDYGNPIGNQFALTQRFVQQSYSLTELRTGYIKCLGALIRSFPDWDLQIRMELSPICRQAIEWLNSNYHKPISARECAAAIPVSSAYLSRLFKKETGRTVTEHLQKLRIEKARQLLEEDCYSIPGIAFKCGFGSTEHFYRTFRKHTGLTPAAYRRNVQRG